MPIDFSCVCGFTISAAVSHSGLYAQCPACQARHRVPRPGAGHLEGFEAEEILLCAACGEALLPPTGQSCIACRAPYHEQCWQEAGGCALPTCDHGPHSRKHVTHTLEEAAATRPCPACKEDIPERAERCRYCGAHVRVSRKARKSR